MKVKKRTSKRETSLSNSILFGAGASAAIIIAATALITTLITERTVELSVIKYIYPVVLFVAGFVASLISGHLAQEGKLLASLGSPAVVLFILIAVTILFFEASFQRVLLGFLALIIGCGTAIILNLRPQKKRKYPRRK